MARYPIKVLLDENRVPFIPYLPSDAVVVNGSNKTVADQITDLHTEINERLSTVYDFKGSVTFENLPITGQKTGDVYDITNDFILNDQKYPAGTNLAWATDHWDPLAGILNIKTVYKKLDLSVAIMPTVSSINGYAFTIEANKAEWLKMINDAVKASEQYVDFVTTKDDGYTFRLYILNTTDGTQNCNMMIYTPPYLLYNLHYADTYWYNKTVKITFADGVATNITVQTGSGYSYREWLFPQFRNTTAFTPTADTHLATKKYVDDGLSLKEALANKITTLLSTSTDTEYPSAKAVYDFVKNNINMGKLTIPNTQNDAVTLQNLKPGLYMFAETLYAYDYYYYFRYKTADNPIYLGKGTVPILLIVYKDPNTVVVPATGTSEEFALVYTWNNNRAGDNTSGYIGVKRFALRYDNQNEVILDMNGNPITYGRTIDNNSQEITGTKTFAAIPKQKTTTAPTLDEQFTNKKYVDDTIAKVTTMPTADSTLEGKVYQYIGTTSGSYIKGHFYECVSDGGSPATYSWNEIQFSSGGSVDVPYYYHKALNSNTVIEFLGSSPICQINGDDQAYFTQIVKECYDKGIDRFILLFRGYYSGEELLLVRIMFNNPGSLPDRLDFISIISSMNFDNLVYKTSQNGKARISARLEVTQSNGVISSYTQYGVFLEASSTYLGVNNISPYTPTSDYHPATKKYVDGEDLTTSVEPENPSYTQLIRTKLKKVGEQFFLQGALIINANPMYSTSTIKLPSSVLFKTIPTTNMSIPLAGATLINFSSTPTVTLPLYTTLNFIASDPDYCHISFSPMDTSTHTLAIGDTFTFNFNWTYLD